MKHDWSVASKTWTWSVGVWDGQPSVFPELIGFWWDRWGVSDVETYLVSYWTGEIATWTLPESFLIKHVIVLPGLKGFWSDIWASVLYIKQKTWAMRASSGSDGWAVRGFQIWQVWPAASYLECRRRTAQVSWVWAALRWRDPYPVDYQPSYSLASQKTRQSNKCVFQ